MPSYITLLSYTDQGIRNIKSSPKRADAARFLATSCVVEMKDLFLTLGEYDLITRVEAELDADVARFDLALRSVGNVRSRVLKAFTEDEYRDIIAKLP